MSCGRRRAVSCPARLCLVGWATPEGTADMVCRGYPGSYPHSHKNKPHSIWSLDSSETISYNLRCCCPSFWQRVHWFLAKPESRLDLADSPSFLAECLVNYRDNTVQTCKIHRKFILNPKIVKQVLLCSLQYSLSSKHNFNTKKYILILT